ncbi:MAG: YceI family protein [Bacteroidia bacterium]|nr:YceI family protein [Bacteroidia bacterium]
MSNAQGSNKTAWAIDPAHTEVTFKVKHLVITTVTGTFSKFEGEVYADQDDFSDAEISFKIDVNSISTNNADRDGHLKSDDFFSAEKYSHLVFSNGKLSKNASGDYKLTGDLTIRDITKKVTLDVDYNGTVKDPWGNSKAGFEITGNINRKEFNLTWNAVTESGGLLVGEDVKLMISVQLAKA